MSLDEIIVRPNRLQQFPVNLRLDQIDWLARRSAETGFHRTEIVRAAIDAFRVEEERIMDARRRREEEDRRAEDRRQTAALRREARRALCNAAIGLVHQQEEGIADYGP